MKTALYCRISPKDVRKRPDTQFRALRFWCEENGHEVTAEFLDQAESSSRLRPGLRAMMQAAQEGGFDQVAVVRWDRFAPDFEYCSQIRATLDRAGVETVIAA